MRVRAENSLYGQDFALYKYVSVIIIGSNRRPLYATRPTSVYSADIHRLQTHFVLSSTEKKERVLTDVECETSLTCFYKL